MNFDPVLNWFAQPERFIQREQLRTARLVVSASFLTSLFSFSYVVLSFIFQFEKGILFTGFNVVGYLLLPFLVRLGWPLPFLVNLFTLIGAVTVLTLTWFSGGMWSAIYPWIIAIPVLALLIAGRVSALIWGALSLACMLGFGWLELRGFEFPVEYNTEGSTLWYMSIVPGLLLIIMVVSMTFEASYRRAIRDIESQKTTIESQAQKLQELVDEKDSIINILAHDLRNPLANMGVLLDLFDAEVNPQERQRLLDMIRKSSTDAHHLVNHVLDMSNLEEGTNTCTLSAVNLAEMLSEVLPTLRKAAEAKGIGVHAHQEEQRVSVLAEPTYLRQVLVNLLSNAVKFSRSGGKIEIHIVNGDREVQLHVRDHGQGISPDDQHRLFRRFTRLGAQPTAGESSSGLGLFLVKRYMELMQGSIRYQKPTHGSGAQFIATFLKH